MPRGYNVIHYSDRPDLQKKSRKKNSNSRPTIKSAKQSSSGKIDSKPTQHLHKLVKSWKPSSRDRWQTHSTKNSLEITAPGMALRVSLPVSLPSSIPLPPSLSSSLPNFFPLPPSLPRSLPAFLPPSFPSSLPRSLARSLPASLRLPRLPAFLPLPELLSPSLPSPYLYEAPSLPPSPPLPLAI